VACNHILCVRTSHLDRNCPVRMELSTSVIHKYIYTLARPIVRAFGCRALLRMCQTPDRDTILAMDASGMPSDIESLGSAYRCSMLHSD
jgi:hypothetical protein